MANSDLLTRYRNEVAPEVGSVLGLDNPLAVPRMQAIVVNMGLGKDQGTEKKLESLGKELALLTGQKPVVTRARKSIAGFKLRGGDKVGLTGSCAFQAEKDGDVRQEIPFY